MLSRLSLRTVFIFGSCFIFIFFVSLLGITFYFEKKLNTSIGLSTQANDEVALILSSKYHIVQIQQFLTDAALTGEPDSIKEAKENLDGFKSILTKLAESRIALKNEFTEISLSAEKLYNVGLEMVEAYQKLGKKAGDEIMKRKDSGLDPLSVRLSQQMDQIVKQIQVEKVRANEITLSSQEQLQNLTITLSLLVILFTAIVLGSIYLRIMPLSEIIMNLSHHSLVVKQTSDLIKNSANSLSQTTSQQVAAATQTSTSLSQISSMVDKTVDNSDQLNSTANVSHEIVTKGQSTVMLLQQAVLDINENNKKFREEVEQNNGNIQEIVKVIQSIGEKTKVINEIVFQTKLLSFNASVEAARAGEQGKGFAVVAEEVGNLASMSGQAAKEISTMLEDGIQKVEQIVISSNQSLDRVLNENLQMIEESKTKAQDCGSSFESITKQFSELKFASDGIAQAIKEQKLGLEEISRALLEFNKTTELNAEASSKTRHTSESLNRQFSDLSRLVFQMQRIVEGDLRSKLSEDHQKLQAS